MGDVTAVRQLRQAALVRETGERGLGICGTGLLIAASLVLCITLSTQTVHAKSKPAKSKDASAASPSEARVPPESRESAYPALDKMEKLLFSRAYVEEDAETRLNRLDKEVFGEAIQGTIEERTAKLDGVLAPRMREKEEAEARRQAEAAEQQAAAAAAAANQTRKEDADAAASRAKVAAQAAREQEIKGLLSEGSNLWRARKGQEALDRFEQVIRLDPNNSEALFSMGVIEEARGNLKNALSRYRYAAEIEKDNTDYADAVAAIEKKIQGGGASGGNEVTRLKTDAAAAFKRGEYFSALDLYKQLDEKSPNQALTKFNIGTIYLMLKDHYNAFDYYKQAHKLAPSEQRYTTAFNDIQAQMKKNKQELDENKKAVEEDYNPGAPKSSKKKDNKKDGSTGGAVAKTPPRPSTPAYKPPQQNPGYQQPPPQQPAYQPPQQNYPPQQPVYQPAQQPTNYPGNPGYPPQQQPYQQQPVYQQPAYQPPPQQPVYQQPPQQVAYQPQQPAYMPQQPSYPQQPVYTQQPAGYPPQQPVYQQPLQQPVYQQQPQQPVYQQQPQQPVYQQQPAYPPQPVYQQPPQQPVYQPQPAYNPGFQQPVSQPTYQQPSQPSGDLSSFGIKGKGGSDGFIVTGVTGGSRAARAGLTNGDIIRTVDGNEVAKSAELEQALNAASSSVKILVFRNGDIVVLNF